MYRKASAAAIGLSTTLDLSRLRSASIETSSMGALRQAIVRMTSRTPASFHS